MAKQSGETRGKAKPAPGKSRKRPSGAKKRAQTAKAKRVELKDAKAAKKPRANTAGRPRAKAAAKPRVKAQACWWALPVSCLMLLILGSTVFLGVSEYAEYQTYQLMRSTVDLDTYYSGILVENYDVSPLNLESALVYWNDNIEPKYRDRVLTLSYQGRTWTINAVDLGYKSNYAEVLNRAWTSGRSGSLAQRYRAVRQTIVNVERYEVSRTLYDQMRLRAWTDSIAGSLTMDAIDAQVSGFDVNAKTFLFSESQAGSGVDADKLFARAEAVLKNGGGTLNIEVQTILPKVDAQALEAKFGQITSAVTNASTSTKNRLTNLKLACEAINGYCVEPGAVFSFNDVVGKRTTAKGYKKATVYQAGDIAEDIGGGVCQVSTTLWNAAMKANCKIIERSEHSRPVSYVDRGKDATVDWGNQDMRFQNTSKSPMYLICYVSSNNRVYCDIYGEKFPDGKYITIEAKTTKTTKPGEPTYIPNPLLPSGQQIVVTEARTGYSAKAYRVYWNGDGTEISRELLCDSHYKMANAVIEYGP